MFIIEPGMRLIASGIIQIIFTWSFTLYNSAAIPTKTYSHDPGGSVDNSCGKIMLAVKSTKRFHSTRLKILRDTWFEWCPNDTFVFSDGDSGEEEQHVQYEGWHQGSERSTRVKVIPTECRTSHDRSDLCCKTGAILESFVSIYTSETFGNLESVTDFASGGSPKDWLCLFDDDNYVNVPALTSFLLSEDALEAHYFGKSSVREPLVLPLVNSLHRQNRPRGLDIGIIHTHDNETMAPFNFATGGAGICLSKATVFQMIPYIKEKRFTRLCDHVSLPDDVTLGYVIENLLGTKLNPVPLFNSHLDDLKLIPYSALKNQLTLSYSLNPLNTISLPVKRSRAYRFRYSDQTDETRFYALHCLITGYQKDQCL